MLIIIVNGASEPLLNPAARLNPSDQRPRNVLQVKLRGFRIELPEIESVLSYIDREDTIEGAADLKPEHLPALPHPPTAIKDNGTTP